MTPKAAFGWRHDQEAAASASIFPMGERQDDRVFLGQRVLSSDYGAGTIDGLRSDGVLIRWDKPFVPGSTTIHLHDYPFVERLEKLPPEETT